MLELAEAEQEQESWFNQSVSKASKTEESRHIQWADHMVEEPEEDWQVEDASDDSSDDEEDDEEFGFALQLTPSHPSQHTPPELDPDSDSSEDESMPPSPPSASLPLFSEKQPSDVASPAYYSSSPSQSSIPPSEQQRFFDEGFYLPQRTQRGLISAIRVC